MVTPQLIVAVFLVAQAWDGIFTYFAVQLFGVAAEGNPLLATWIFLAGPEPAIVGAKLLASTCGVVLYIAGRYRELLGLTLLYAVSAIGPWMAIFHQL